MAQFVCQICGEGFDQKSRYERHLETSHPPRATSAADVERALEGTSFPKGRAELTAQARAKGQEAAASLIASLPDRQYRDAAEVARALGELRSHEHKPQHQPSRAGGKGALKSLSAARIASALSGAHFPASGPELKDYAQKNEGDEEVLQVVARFRDKTYQDMSDVAKEIGRVT